MVWVGTDAGAAGNFSERRRRFRAVPPLKSFKTGPVPNQTRFLIRAAGGECGRATPFPGDQGRVRTPPLPFAVLASIRNDGPMRNP